MCYILNLTSGVAKLKRKRDDDGNDEHRPKKRKQQMITEHFPLRRSSRQTKSMVEKEKFDAMAEKLKNKEEEGIEKFATEEKGWGVRSTRPFSKGEFICEYSGELISAEEAKDREARYALVPEVGCYMYYFEFLGRKMCVDATADNKRHGRLLNHSKINPNVVTKMVILDNVPYLCLVAGRDICKGEQLEYDYGDRSKMSVQSHPWLVK